MEPYDVVQRSLSPKHSTIMPVAADPVLRQPVCAGFAPGVDVDMKADGRQPSWYWCNHCGNTISQHHPTVVADAIEAWGDVRVEVAVSAARAETAERIAQALEAFEGTIGCARAIDPVLFDLQVVAHNPVQGEAMHKVIGYTAARYCAGVARGVGTAEGDTQQ